MSDDVVVESPAGDGEKMKVVLAFCMICKVTSVNPERPSKDVLKVHKEWLKQFPDVEVPSISKGTFWADCGACAIDPTKAGPIRLFRSLMMVGVSR